MIVAVKIKQKNIYKETIFIKDSDYDYVRNSF